MNVYVGTFNDDDWYQVTLNGKSFKHKESLRLRQHSPDGFSWGYLGSGCAQLSLGILQEEFGDKYARYWYQRFKEDVISKFPKSGFTLTSEQVVEWAKTHPLLEEA